MAKKDLSPPSRGVRRKARLIERDGDRCHYCEDRGTTADHVIPEACGGTYALDNLVLACQPCNTRRGHLNYVVFCEVEGVEPDWRRYREALKALRRADAIREENVA